MKVQRKERWQPFGLTARGARTIAVCGLDRPGLLTSYTDHVVREVRPKLEPLFAAAKAGDAKGVVKAWSSAKRSLLHPARPFRALSYDAMDVLVPLVMREAYNLGLERPS